MGKFNWDDQPLADKPKKFNWDDHPLEKQNGAAITAIDQLGSGLAGNFYDEINGGAEALGKVGLRVEPELSGKIDGIARANGLGIGPECGGRVGRGNRVLGHGWFPSVVNRCDFNIRREGPLRLSAPRRGPRQSTRRCHRAVGVRA